MPTTQVWGRGSKWPSRDEADKQVIYERIDACLTDFDTLVRSSNSASSMAWFKSGRKAVSEMVVEQATEAAGGEAAKLARKKADKAVHVVPETSEDEGESESEAV